MSRKRTIALTGIAILTTLALIERATNSVALVPANVVAVDPIVPDAGPDKWRIVFELSDRTEYATDPVAVRPTLGLGDPICVRMHDRSWAKPKFTLTSQTSCWDGALTPLRAPD